DPVANREPIMKMARCEPDLDLRLSCTGTDPPDREAVVVGPGNVRQRIGSHDRASDAWNRQSNRQELARQIRRQWLSILRHEVERADVFGLAKLPSQEEGTETCPGRSLSDRPALG